MKRSFSRKGPLGAELCHVQPSPSSEKARWGLGHGDKKLLRVGSHLRNQEVGWCWPRSPHCSPQSPPPATHCSPLAAREVSSCQVIEGVQLSLPLCLQSVGWYLAPALRILELRKNAASQRWWASPWGWRTRGLWTCPTLMEDGRNSAHFPCSSLPSSWADQVDPGYSVLLASSLPFFQVTLRSPDVYRSGVRPPPYPLPLEFPADKSCQLPSPWNSLPKPRAEPLPSPLQAHLRPP